MSSTLYVMYWQILSVVAVVISDITNAQRCSSGRDIELLVDDQLVPTNTILYRSFNSSFSVRCRKCSGTKTPSWFNSNGTDISTSCGSGVPICTKEANEDQVNDLIFSFFEESLEGEYRCTRNNRDGAINITIIFG